MYRKKRHPKIYIFIGIAVVALPLVSFIYSYVTLNLWISADAHKLESYPHILVKDGQVVPHVQEHDESIRNLEQALIQYNTSENRIVVILSRSNIKFNLLRTKAYVKLFLQTALPTDSTQTSKIKLLNILVRRDGQWVVDRLQNLSIE